MTTDAPTDRLDITVRAVADAHGNLAAAEADRDDAIREVRAAGMSALDLAARTGLSVPRIYQILSVEEET